MSIVKCVNAYITGVVAETKSVWSTEILQNYCNRRTASFK